MQQICKQKRQLLSYSGYSVVVWVIVYVFKNPIEYFLLYVGFGNLFDDLNFGVVSILSAAVVSSFAIGKIGYNIAKKDLLPTPTGLLLYINVLMLYFILRDYDRLSDYEIWYGCPVFYSDIVVLFVPVFFLPYSKYGLVKSELGMMSFLEDTVATEAEDLLHRNSPILPDRNGLVSVISNIINNTVTKEAFGIAIVGRWGEGKTTFLHYLECQIKKQSQNNVVVWFNPWTAGNRASIYDSFFEKLICTLRPYSKVAADSLGRYAKLFSDSFQTNPILKVMKSSLEFSNPNDTVSRFHQVNSLISQTGLRIVVVIDDIDRLTGDEILEVLKMIRGVADFGNTFFLVGFDFEYVVKTIELTETVSDIESYLQKIFQCTIQLPTVRKSIFVDQIRRSIKQFITDKREYQDFERALAKLSFVPYETDGHHKGILEQSLQNVRDLKRFLNHLQTSYSILKGEVELHELILIELLKIRSPRIFRMLSERKFIKNGNSNPASYAFDLESYETQMKGDISFDIGKLILSSLFSGLNSHRSIVRPNVFAIHMNYQLFTMISLTEWNLAKNGTISELYLICDKWIREGKRTNLEIILKSLQLFDDYDSYVKFLKLFLMLENFRDNGHKHYVFLYDVTYAIQGFQSYFPDKKIEEFLFDLFSVPEIHTRTKAQLCYEMLKHSLTLTDFEYKSKRNLWSELAIKLLKEEIRRCQSEYSPTVRDIHWCNLDYFGKDNRAVILSYDSCTIVREYLVSVFESFLPNVILKENPNDAVFEFDPWLKQVFPSGEINRFITLVASVPARDELSRQTKNLVRRHMSVFEMTDWFFVIDDKQLADRLVKMLDHRDNKELWPTNQRLA